MIDDPLLSRLYCKQAALQFLYNIPILVSRNTACVVACMFSGDLHAPSAIWPFIFLAASPMNRLQGNELRIDGRRQSRAFLPLWHAKELNPEAPYVKPSYPSFPPFPWSRCFLGDTLFSK